MNELTNLQPKEGIPSLMGVGGFSILTILISVAWSIASIVALCIIFKKNGRPWFFAIIPFVNLYTLFAIFWSKKNFWWFVLMVVGMVFIPAIIIASGSVALAEISIILILFMAMIMLTWMVILYAKIADAYGHGAGFTIGLLLLYPIFLIILATKNPVKKTNEA